MRNVRTSQPQGPCGIDWSSPITRGLEVWMNGADNSTYRATSGSGGRTATPVGWSPLLSAAQSYLIPAAKPRASVGGVTVFSVTLAGASGPSGFILDAYNSLSNVTIRYPFSGTLQISVTDAANVYTSSNVFWGVPPDVPVVACVALSSPTNTVKQYLSGTLQSSGTTGWLTNLQYAATAVANLGGDFAGSCPLILIFNRALSDAEVKSLSDNPWQVFQPVNRSIWTPGASAEVTLPTLVRAASTTSAGDWTATGAATLHEAINEVVPSDAQYISVNSASSYTFRLAEAAYPGTANQTVAYRASSVSSSTFTIRLFQGATTLMERTHALTPTDTLYTQTLTAGEIAIITAGAVDCTLTTS